VGFTLDMVLQWVLTCIGEWLLLLRFCQVLMGSVLSQHFCSIYHLFLFMALVLFLLVLLIFLLILILL